MPCKLVNRSCKWFFFARFGQIFFHQVWHHFMALKQKKNQCPPCPPSFPCPPTRLLHHPTRGFMCMCMTGGGVHGRRRWELAARCRRTSSRRRPAAGASLAPQGRGRQRRPVIDPGRGTNNPHGGEGGLASVCWHCNFRIHVHV